MLRKVTVLAGLVIIGVGFFNCHTLKNLDKEVFKINQAYYQPWIVSEDEKGTDIIVELSDVEEAVDFDSIVFRGVRMKAFAEQKERTVELKSILPAGKSRIIDLENHVVNLPDQLIYHFQGKRVSYPLKITERKSDKIY